MSHRDADELSNPPYSTATAAHESSDGNPLGDTRQLVAHETPDGLDRRSFLMRAAVGGAAAVMTGCADSPAERTAKAAATAQPAAPAEARSSRHGS